MAEPVRASADDQGPPAPEGRRPDPRAPGWVLVQQAIIANAHAAGHAATELACRPDGDDAREMATLTREAFERAVDVGRQWVVNDASLAEQRQRGFDEGVAAERARRCRLEVIDGGRGIPGPR